MADKDDIEDAEVEPVTDLVEIPSGDEPAVDAEEHEEHEDEEHTSLSKRILQILMILLVGMGIGIWAAPKIAPLLPKGMAPIAQWLSPSDNASMEEVAALRREVVSRLIQLESLPGNDAFEARLAGFQTDITDPLRAQMTTLSNQVGTADSTALESRLWALESRVEGLIVELSGLTAALGTVSTEGGTISADMAASISAYRTRIDAMQAEIDNLAGHQGGISTRLDELDVAVNGQLEAARAEVIEVEQDQLSDEKLAELRSAVQTIAAAIDSGVAFADPMAVVLANSDVEIGEGLTSRANTGARTLKTLQEEFVPAAHEAIRAGIGADADGGAFASIGAFLQSQVATRSLTEQEGDSVDAILSRVEAALNRADLAQAITQAKTLPEAAQDTMQEWITHAEWRAGVLTSFDDMVTALDLGEAQ